jgi:hypothetical protein
MMLNHLWNDTDELESEARRRRMWARPTTRQPAARRGGARRAVGRALMGLGSRIADEPTASQS